MSKIETYACDVCHTQRKEANHWWKVHRVDGGALVLGWDDELTRLVGTVETADAHLCGVQHVLEWLSKHVLEPSQ